MLKAAVIIGSLLVGACSVGEVNSLATGGGDGGGSGSGSGSGSGNGCMAAESPGTAHPHLAGGVTHAGENCIVAGCHLAGQTATDAPAFEFAGTLYKSGTTTPYTGAIVIITPLAAGGVVIPPIVTDTAGNFNYEHTDNADMPASVAVTACPTITTSHMMGAVPPPIDTNTTPVKAGACNGCHQGTTDPVISL